MGVLTNITPLFFRFGRKNKTFFLKTTYRGAFFNLFLKIAKIMAKQPKRSNLFGIIVNLCLPNHGRSRIVLFKTELNPVSLSNILHSFSRIGEILPVFPLFYLKKR